MFSEVQAILAKQLRKPAETITMESKIKEDLGADSLDILQLLLRLEDDYGLIIPDASLSRFVTVGDVVKYMESTKK